MADQGSSPTLSVVVPFYNEAESAEAVCREVHDVLSAQPGLDWELVMVDDGSTDGTGPILDELAR